MAGRYQFTLSPQLLHKAAAELNEPRNDKERWQAIDELKSKYNEIKYGPLLSTDDKFILMFLRSRKFDQKQALKVLHKYHKMRVKFRLLFDLVDDQSKLKAIHESGQMWVGEERGQNGEYIYFYKPTTETNRFTPYEVFAYGQVCIAHLFKNEEAQICGMITIDDFTHYNHRVTKNVPSKDLKRITALLQDGTPVPMKPIHYIGESKLVDVLFKLIKPFMKKSLTEQFHMHGMDFQKLHDTIPLKALPPCYGGTGPDCKESHEKWVENMTLNIP